jgi:tRNA A-37 threonylcarbamoyl transferase component Bud32
MGVDARHIVLRDGTCVLEEHAEAFNDFDGKRRAAKVVKDLNWKKTLEYPAGARTYFIKIYKIPTWTKRLKNLLFGSRARREWDMSHGVRLRGIPQAAVVAMKESGHETWVAIEKLADWAQLQETILAAPDRRRLCLDYGRFARRLHDSGIWQYDFNPTNILVKGREFLLIDFERMQLYPAGVPGKVRLKSLAKMNRIPSVSRTDRLRFLKGYLGSVYLELKAWKQVADEILRLYKVQIEHDHDKSGRRCLDDNRDFGPFEIGEWRGHYRKRNNFRPGGVTLEEVRSLAEGSPDSYRFEAAPDAIAAWQQANRNAYEGGPTPVAVIVKRSSPEGRIAFPRT